VPPAVSVDVLRLENIFLNNAKSPIEVELVKEDPNVENELVLDPITGLVVQG
jgi:hypothetical protein